VDNAPSRTAVRRNTTTKPPAMTAEHSPALPQRDSRWLMLGLLFACRTGLGYQFQTLGSVSDPLIAQFGFRYAEIGTLIGLFMLPGLVLALPAGYAGRYLSDRTLAAIGLLCLAAGGGIAALAPGFGMLTFGRIAAGIGFVFSTLYFTKGPRNNKVTVLSRVQTDSVWACSNTRIYEMPATSGSTRRSGV
jgi:MFS family permease